MKSSWSEDVRDTICMFTRALKYVSFKDLHLNLWGLSSLNFEWQAGIARVFISFS